MALQEFQPHHSNRVFGEESTRTALLLYENLYKDLQSLERPSQECGPWWFLIKSEQDHFWGFKLDVGIGTLPHCPGSKSDVGFGTQAQCSGCKFRYFSSVHHWTCCPQEPSCTNFRVRTIRRVAQILLPDVNFPLHGSVEPLSGICLDGERTLSSCYDKVKDVLDRNVESSQHSSKGTHLCSPAPSLQSPGEPHSRSPQQSPTPPEESPQQPPTQSPSPKAQRIYQRVNKVVDRTIEAIKAIEAIKGPKNESIGPIKMPTWDLNIWSSYQSFAEGLLNYDDRRSRRNRQRNRQDSNQLRFTAAAIYLVALSPTVSRQASSTMHYWLKRVRLVFYIVKILSRIWKKNADSLYGKLTVNYSWYGGARDMTVGQHIEIARTVVSRLSTKAREVTLSSQNDYNPVLEVCRMLQIEYAVADKAISTQIDTWANHSDVANSEASWAEGPRGEKRKRGEDPVDEQRHSHAEPRAAFGVSTAQGAHDCDDDGGQDEDGSDVEYMEHGRHNTPVASKRRQLKLATLPQTDGHTGEGSQETFQQSQESGAGSARAGVTETNVQAIETRTGRAAQGVPDGTNQTCEGCRERAVSAMSGVVDGVQVSHRNTHFNHPSSYPPIFTAVQNGPTQCDTIDYAQHWNPSACCAPLATIRNESTQCDAIVFAQHWDPSACCACNAIGDAQHWGPTLCAFHLSP